MTPHLNILHRRLIVCDEELDVVWKMQHYSAPPRTINPFNADNLVEIENAVPLLIEKQLLHKAIFSFARFTKRELILSSCITVFQSFFVTGFNPIAINFA